MVSRGSARYIFAPVGAVVMTLALAAGIVLAEDTDCVVHVDPPAATGGSVFVFSGSGFKPDELRLRKAGDQPIRHELNIGDDDPWEVTVRSRVGDEGSWTARFSTPDGCTAVAEFEVTLKNTDMVADLLGQPADTGSAAALAALYVLVVVGGFGGGVLIARRVFGDDARA